MPTTLSQNVVGGDGWGAPESYKTGRPFIDDVLDDGRGVIRFAILYHRLPSAPPRGLTGLPASPLVYCIYTLHLLLPPHDVICRFPAARPLVPALYSTRRHPLLIQIQY